MGFHPVLDGRNECLWSGDFLFNTKIRDTLRNGSFSQEADHSVVELLFGPERGAQQLRAELEFADQLRYMREVEKKLQITGTSELEL